MFLSDLCGTAPKNAGHTFWLELLTEFIYTPKNSNIVTPYIILLTLYPTLYELISSICTQKPDIM